jgi:hypothetical protein
VAAGGRLPLRLLVRVAVRSYRPAPIFNSSAIDGSLLAKWLWEAHSARKPLGGLGSFPISGDLHHYLRL